MLLPRFEYLRAASLEQCLAVLQESGKESRLLAGGTDLLVKMKHRVICPERVIGIRAIPELCAFSEDGEGNVRIGAGATLSDLAGNPHISKRFPALHGAIRSVASGQIRNMATIGGNICLETRCWYYNQSQLWRDALEPCHRTGGSVCHAIGGARRCHAINKSDIAPMLMALDAQVCVSRKGGERVIPITDFYRDDGERHTVLEPDEILTSVLIPEGAASSFATFIKVSDRKGLDFAEGSIGASVKGNGKGVLEVKLVINSLVSAPLLLKKAARTIMESGFTDKSISDAADTARSELGTVTNLFTTAGYKRQLAGALVKRALQGLQAQIQGKRMARS